MMPTVVYRRSHEPTPAQHAAGNYSMTPRRFAGLDCTVETKAGETRGGVSRAGVAWSVRMLFDYGYVKGSLGVDGDHVDVYLGPNEDAPFVYIVRQQKAGRWSEYDEDKCMLGFDSADDAEAVFRKHYTDARFFGGMQAMPIEEFRSKVLATRAAGGAMIKSQEIMRNPRLVLLLKATVKKQITVPGHVREGKWVAAYTKWVNVNPDVPQHEVLSGKGSASQIAAHKKLAAAPWWQGLDDDTKFHTLLAEATDVQAKWSLDATVSVWKKKTQKGEKPTEAEWKAYFSLPPHIQQKLFFEAGASQVQVETWAKVLKVPVGGVYGQPAPAAQAAAGAAQPAPVVQPPAPAPTAAPASFTAIPVSTELAAALVAKISPAGTQLQRDEIAAALSSKYGKHAVMADGLVVAAIASGKNTSAPKATFEIQHLGSVAPGAGSALVAAVKQQAASAGLPVVIFSHPEATGFWTKMGFAQVAGKPAGLMQFPSAAAAPAAPAASSSMWAFNPKDQGFSYMPTLTVPHADGGLVYVAFTEDAGFQVGSLDAEGEPRWYADHDDLPKALHELAQHDGIPKIPPDVLAKLAAAAAPTPTPTKAKPFADYGKYEPVPIEVAIPVMITAGWAADPKGGFVLTGKSPGQSLHSDGLAGGGGIPKDWLVSMLEMAEQKKAQWASEDAMLAKKPAPVVNEAAEDLKLLATEGTYYQKIAVKETPYLAEHLGKWTGYTPEQQKAAVLEHSAALQAKASASAAVSLWKKAALDGKNPTPGQWKAFATLPIEKQNEYTDTVFAKVGITHLSPPPGLMPPGKLTMAPVSPLAAAAAAPAAPLDLGSTSKGEDGWAAMPAKSLPHQLQGAGKTPAKWLMAFKEAIVAGSEIPHWGMVAYISLPKPKMVALREALKAKVGPENFFPLIKEARSALHDKGWKGFSIGTWSTPLGKPFEPLAIDGSDVMQMPGDKPTAPAADTDLPEGSTKTVDGVSYVLKDHRWHKVKAGGGAGPTIVSQVPPVEAFPIYHNTQQGHNKWWGGLVVGTTLYTRYGPIGKPGQISSKQFPTPGAAQQALGKLLAEKTGKGYDWQHWGEPWSPAATAPAAAPAQDAGPGGLPVQLSEVGIDDPQAQLAGFAQSMLTDAVPTAPQTLAMLSLGEGFSDQFMAALHDNSVDNSLADSATMKLLDAGYTKNADGAWVTPAGQYFLEWVPDKAEFDKMIAALTAPVGGAPKVAAALPHQLGGKNAWIDPVAQLKNFLSAVSEGATPSQSQTLAYLSLPLALRQDVVAAWVAAGVDASPPLNAALQAFKASGYYFHEPAGMWATPDGKLFVSWIPEDFETIVADTIPGAGPKEGEKKQGADGMLVFHNGRWHKDSTAPPQAFAPPKKKAKYIPVAVKNVQAVDPAAVLAWLNKCLAAKDPMLPVPAAMGAILSNQTKWLWLRNRVKGAIALDGVPNKTQAYHLARARVLAAAFGLHKLMVKTDGTTTDGGINVFPVGKAKTEISIDPAFIKLVALKAAWLHVGKRPPADLVAMLPESATVIAQAPAPAAPAAPAQPPLPPNPGAGTTVVDGLTTIDTKGWKQVGPQEGYNDGGYFNDPATGEKYYLKFPSGGEHVVRNEILANRLYALAGCKVPTLTRCVRDGKVGLASLIVAGSKDKAGLLAGKMPGLFEGFAADAWLANWDTVGNNPAAGKGFDNIQRMPDGSAVRIDAGGALLYGGAGSKKGQFTEEVVELKTMRNPSVNANTAAVFGKMTEADIAASVANVLKIPNSLITESVLAFGPGDAKAKLALATKLIARKDNMAAQFPAAAKKAAAGPTLTPPGTKKAPKPDPTKLPVKPSDLPEMHTFLNWGGAGKPISDKPYVLQNVKDEEAIRDFALKGNLVALKAYKFQPVDKLTGAPAGEPLPMEKHPSTHVRQFYDNCVLVLDQIANPPEPLHIATLENAQTVADLAAAFKPFDYGVSVGKAPGNQRLGFWIALGQALNPEKFVPPTVNIPMSAAELTKGKAKAAAYPQQLRAWLKSVKGSGSANQPYRDGAETDHSGRNCRKVLQDAYANATTHAPGTTIYKGIDFVGGMLQQMKNVALGTVIQNPGSMCCSYKKSTSESWAGNGFLTIHYAPGAVGLDNYSLGTSYDSEAEVTSIPGCRFMVLSKKYTGSRLDVEVLMLPPDQTYIANLGKKGAANG